MMDDGEGAYLMGYHFAMDQVREALKKIERESGDVDTVTSFVEDLKEELGI